MKASRLYLILTLLYVIVYGVVINLPFKAKKMGDGDFHREARTIALYLHGERDYDDLAITKAPGPVLFNIIPYTLVGPDADDDSIWLACVLWTGAVSLVTMILLVRQITARHGVVASYIFLGITFIIPIHIYYSLGILAESLAYIACCWMLIGYLSKEKKWAFYTFTVLGMVALILARPNAGLIIPLVIVFSGVVYWIKRDTQVFRYAFAAIVSFIVVSGVTWGVKKLPNQLNTLKQEEYLGHVLLHGRFQFREETFDWRFWDDQSRSGSVDYENWKQTLPALHRDIQKGSSFSQVYFGWVVNDVTDHPLLFVKQVLVRLIFGNTLQVGSAKPEKFKVGPVNGKIVYWVVHLFLNIINLAVLVLALWQFSSRSRFFDHWPLLCIILALIIFSALVYMEQRYIFPYRPIITFLAAMSLRDFLVQRNYFSLRQTPSTDLPRE